MTLKAQVARGMKWKVITIVGRQVLSFFVFTTLARLLDPSAFGLVGLAGVYLAFVNMFVDQGIGMAIVQREKLEPEHLDAAFWFNMGCGLVLSLVTIVLAGPIARLFGEPQLVPLLRWSTVGLMIGAATEIQAYLLVREMDFRRPALRILLGNLAGGVVGVAMAFAGFGVWSLVGQQIATALAGSIFLWTAGDYRPAWRFSVRHLRDLLRVSFSVFSSGFLWFFSSRLDQIAIGRFIGVPALGLYVIAGKIPDLARIVVHDGIADVSLPALARLQNDHARMREVIYRGMELNAVVSFAVFVGIAAIAPDLVPLLFGAKWAAAGSLCSLLAVYTLVNVLQVFFHPTLLASGGMGKWVLLNAWHAAGVLIACIAGVRFGINVLVAGLILNAAIITIPSLLFLRQRVGLRALVYFRPCLTPALAALLMVVVVIATRHGLPERTAPLVRLGCTVAAGAAGYLGFLFVFKRSSLERLLDTARHAISSKTRSFTPKIVSPTVQREIENDPSAPDQPDNL
jgi:O-antigen/teichoic acid export membrane protein